MSSVRISAFEKYNSYGIKTPSDPREQPAVAVAIGGAHAEYRRQPVSETRAVPVAPILGRMAMANRERTRLNQQVSAIPPPEPEPQEEVPPPSSTPIDNVNVCFVGGVSTGKSTILNAIFCEELTQCKIKRTTMVPTVYVENPSDTKGLDSPERIFASIAEKNREIIEKTESGISVPDSEYAELQFNVGKLDINILPDSMVNVYDIPGLNDARTKSVYYRYLQRNFHRFNLVVFIVDIHSGLNTSDEADILNFIADHTRQQLDKNQKKIYTLVVVNKADDMQLIPESEDDKLEITGELGEMFDQVEKTVNEVFLLRNIAEHLVGIIPLCAIDSYLYRMTQKHGDKFKLSPEQILKIGINENGKKFSTLKPKTQEAKVREILNDKEFVGTMIKLSGFGHFEKRLHSFLTQSDTGRQLRIENLLFSMKSLPEITPLVKKATTPEHIVAVADLVGRYFETYNRILKIDPAIGNGLIESELDNVERAFWDTLASVLKTATIKKINVALHLFEAFRDNVFVRYFATWRNYKIYPRNLCDAMKSRIQNILTNQRIKPSEIVESVHLLEKIGALTQEVFAELNDSILINVHRFSAIAHSPANRQGDDADYAVYIRMGEHLGVDMTAFVRFILIGRISEKSYYSESELFEKTMLYLKYREVPVYTYLQFITSKLNPSPEWFLLEPSSEDPTHRLDMVYLLRSNPFLGKN